MAINERRLTFPEMKIDKAPFPVHTIDLSNANVLIRPDQAEGAKGKNVIIGDDRPLTVDNKILAREVIKEKTPDGKKNMRIILKPRMLGGKRVLLQATGLLLSRDQSDRFLRPVPVRSPWWSAPDIQDKVSRSGYMED